MATVNQVGNSLTGSTGSGAFVGATSPTLVTPVLGVASATSINFGGGALSNYVPRTAWTPVFTFDTPGDLALSAITIRAWYQRIGDGVLLFCDYSFTATFTTSSGTARITGLPISSVAGQGSSVSCISFGNNVTYPVGTTVLGSNIAGGSSNIILFAIGSLSGTNLTTANFTSATPNTLRFVTQYYVN